MFLWRIVLVACYLLVAISVISFGEGRNAFGDAVLVQNVSEPDTLRLNKEFLNFESFRNTYFYILDDSLRQFAIQDVLYKDFERYDAYVAFGRQIDANATYWTKIRVQNTMADNNQWILTLSPLNSITEMYIRQADGSFKVKRAGKLVPVREKEFPGFTGVAFSLNIPYGETREIYFKTERYTNFYPRFGVNFETWSYWTSVTNDHHKLALHSFMQGALWLMAGFFLFCFFSSKIFIYFYYSIFLVLQALYFLFEGYPYPLNWLLGEHVGLILYVWVFANLLYVFFAAFVRAFVNAPKLIPSLDFLFVVMICVRSLCAFGALVIITLWYDFKLADQVYSVYLMPFELLCWSILVPFIFIKGDKITRVFMCGVVIYILSAVGLTHIVINTNINDYWVVYLHTFGFLLQFLFLSLVMGYKFVRLINQSKSAQKRYITQLQKTQQMQEIVNQDLESKVKERTARIDIQNQALLQKSRRLKELDQLKSRFLANISHEFRTPLTLIQGSLQKLYHQSKDPVAQLEYEKIMDHGHSLLTLINQLLQLSDHQQPKVNATLTKVDVAEFVKTIARSFDTHAEIKRIHYQYKLPRYPVMALCDPDKLRRIIENLLSNAFKFTSQDKQREVSLCLSRTKDHQHYTIDVKDTGIGIPEEKLSLIFDRFYRVDQHNEVYEHTGTGIGLSLVKEYVQMMNGTISVESTEGKGSCFSVRLPIDQQTPSYPDFVFRQEPKAEDTGVFSEEHELVVSKENHDELPEILIVEDHAEVRNFLKETLQPHYFVIEARHGMEGFTLAKSHIPDMIITDLMMPGINGMEFCQKVKAEELTSHIPVIMLTAKADQQSRLAGWNMGADAYITKPFDLAELHARIKSMLHNRKKLQHKFMQKLSSEKSVDIIKDPEEELFLKKLETVLQRNYQRADFQIDDLVGEMYMSRSPFYRKLKSLTGESPNTLMKKYRLKRAARLLAEDGGTIAEISEAVGFNSDSYFTKCFVEEYGHRPSEHRQMQEDTTSQQ